MSRQEIHDRLREVFRSVFDDPGLEIDDTTTAADIPDWTSLRHVDLVVATEGAFSVHFATREIRSLANVGAFIDLILHKLG